MRYKSKIVLKFIKGVTLRKILVLDQENTNQQNFHLSKTQLQDAFRCLFEQFHKNSVLPLVYLL